MNLFIRFFDLMTTLFFILWAVSYLIEMYDLSVICLAAVAFFCICMIALRLFVYYKITLRRLED